MTVSLLLLPLVACHADPAGSDSPVVEVFDVGTPFVAPDLDPEWTPQEAAANGQAALDLGWPDPGVLADTWWALINDDGDATCPGEDHMSTPNLQGCTAASGTTFTGLAVWNEMSDTQALSDWMLTGDFVITTAEGRAFIAGGSTGARRELEGGTTRFSGDVRGTWQFDDADDWLGAGVSEVMRAEGQVDSDRSIVVLDGVVGVGLTAMDLQRIQLVSDLCEGHAIGRMALRDPSGGWFELDSTDRCDGCFDVTWADEPMGEACLDLRPATADLVEGLLE